MRVCQRRGCEMPLLNKGCSAYFCLIWKPVRMDCRVDRDLTVQPQTAREEHRKVLPHFPMFHSPFPLSTDSVPFGPRTQSLSIVRRSITLHAGTSCKAFKWLRSKISWDIWQISCEIEDCRRRSRRKLCKKLDAAGRFESFFFLFARARAKCGRNGPSMQTHGGHPCSTQFCKSAARLAGLAKLSSRSNGLEGQIEPELRQDPPLEAILVIFGRRALIFFLFESSWKKMKNDATFVRMRSGDHLGDAKMSKKGTSLRRI